VSDSPVALVSLIAFPARPGDRLRLALRRLDSALEAQREAVAAWRTELGKLGSAMQGLDTSVADLRDGLTDAAEAVQRADEEVRRLDRTADAMPALAARQADALPRPDPGGPRAPA
jgi:predicted trehalose synthase